MWQRHAYFYCVQAAGPVSPRGIDGADFPSGLQCRDPESMRAEGSVVRREVPREPDEPVFAEVRPSWRSISSRAGA
jgi:hypothetical protein